MPVTSDIIIALSAVIGAAVAAWGVLRKLRPEIQRLKSESDKLAAEAALARSERDAAEAKAMESITTAAHTLVDPLVNEINLLRAGREDDRKRIRDLEGNLAKYGQENVELRCKVESLEHQNITLTEEINSLRRIVDDYRSGRRKPTGQLPAEGGQS